nr:sigma-70 family RNA polymerase sigma factor [uncultured Desulfobacter sp.]
MPRNAKESKKEPAANSPPEKYPGHPVDEDDLIRRLKQGQQWACNTLVDLYQERLLKLAWGITLDKEESREIVQDIFFTAIKKIDTFRGESSLWAWLRKMTVNACLNWKRKWKRRFRWHHTPIETETLIPAQAGRTQEDTPETLLQEKQAYKAVADAVARLPEDVRTAFVLCSFEGLSYQEIAQVLGIKKGTVSSRVFRARQMISRSIEPKQHTKK